MIILGIETSCDETAAAVLEKKDKSIHILSNVVASSALLQAKYGGVIPEQAAREQIKAIIPVIKEALEQAQVTSNKLDAVAVTYGPGLIGSLLVGVETAKTLATIWNKPLIPINHLLGHFYANWIANKRLDVRSEKLDKEIRSLKIENPTSNFQLQDPSSNFQHPTSNLIPAFPCLGLLVSGGHTDLVLFTDHGKYKYLGGTRDDACGECFDKCARLLGLSYPGGPQISKLAQKGDPNKFKLPIPMKDSKDFDFSYSGLKTAVANIVRSSELVVGSEKADLAATIEKTIVISLVEKVVLAIQKYQVEQIMVAGGVAANQLLVLKLQIQSAKLKVELHIPPPNLCTDNGAMIAAAGFFSKPIKNSTHLQADPNLSLS